MESKKYLTVNLTWKKISMPNNISEQINESEIGYICNTYEKLIIKNHNDMYKLELEAKKIAKKNPGILISIKYYGLNEKIISYFCMNNKRKYVVTVIGNKTDEQLKRQIELTYNQITQKLK